MSQTTWIQSPVNISERSLCLYREIRIHPFVGNRRTYQLRHTSYIIGSDLQADIRINDPHISARHARLILKEGIYHIEDLDSKNGILLNGVRVFSAPLGKQGHLRIGRSTIQWSETSKHDDLELPADWIVENEKMLASLSELKSVAKSDLPILILGETGSGKEAIASLIHQWSYRANNTYLPFNAAQADGPLVDSELFGHARGAFTGAEKSRLGALKGANKGTLFLDEIGDLPLGTQVKLLRALESGEVKSVGMDRASCIDVRLVSATSQNLEKKISENQMRSDFYFRIAAHVFHVPPLRERPEDILAIAKNVAKRRAKFIAPEAEVRLQMHAWPGNVRELKGVVERAILLAERSQSSNILPEHILFSSIHATASIFGDGALTMDQIQERAILRALNRCGGSRSIAAKELGIARSTLFDKLRKFQRSVPNIIPQQD